MGKIEIKTDCGNAPRRIFLAALNTAFTKGDLSYLTDNIPDDIILEKIGTTKIYGKEDCISAIKKGPYWKSKLVTLDTIITHGREASVSGQIISADNLRFSFCDVYKFKGAGGTAIKEILRFLIRIPDKRS